MNTHVNSNHIAYLAIKEYDPEIVIMVPYKNSEKTIYSTLDSIFDQLPIPYRFIILISDDNSICSAKEVVKTIYNNKIIQFLYANFNSTFLNRNYLISVSRYLCKNLKVLVRLDADDIFENKYVLKNICKYFFTSSFCFFKPTTRNTCELLLLGNSLYKSGIKIDRLNLATVDLKSKTYLKDRLFMMSLGKSEYELPSCNLVWSSSQTLTYPNLRSAEDHFLLIYCLLFKKRLLHIEENELLAGYSLSGNLTNTNKQKNYYLRARKILLEFINFYG